jgi:hypothetical protein
MIIQLDKINESSQRVSGPLMDSTPHCFSGANAMSHQTTIFDSLSQVEMRTCKVCYAKKPIDDFQLYKAKGWEGRRRTCRSCWNAKWTPVVATHNKKYYHENKNGYADKAKARATECHKKDHKSHCKRNQNYAERHPEKHAAKLVVAKAIRQGTLVRLSCQVCGSQPAQAHHDDYNKQLDVIWLCRSHHGERHRLLNRKTPIEQWPIYWPMELRA